MWYLLNDKYFKDGPIFMYAGNEGQVEKFYENSGFLIDTLGAEFKALIVFPEHRYFGKSWPFGTKEESMKKENV